MSKNWKRLHAALQKAEGRDFEREALPFIRAIWGDAIIPQPLRSTYDKSGVDILAWKGADTLSIRLAVQCKGFKVEENELGADQIRQCRESVESFRKSGIRADTYVLLHNRIPNSEAFRDALQLEVKGLKKSGQVKKAYVWGAQKLIQEASRKVRERCVRILRLNRHRAEEFRDEPAPYSPLERVPLQISEMVVNPNRKVGETGITEAVADPAERLLQTGMSNLSLVLARAGYGKTTAALRTVAVSSRRVFYLSAATLPRGVNNTHSLIARWINLDELYKDALAEDVPVLEQLAGPALNYILKDEKTPVVLILDALDESIYFSRSGGLQQLFNQLRDTRVPVVLLARSEFWESRQGDFADSYGPEAASRDKLVRRRVSVIRLKDWEHEQIKELARRYRDTLTGPGRDNLDELLDIIDTGEYEGIYGDIPKRPLFLRFILESVAEQGIVRKGKARLIYEWAELKVRRDVLNPRRFGAEGRMPILTGAEDTETAIRLAFKAMKLAAREMTTRGGGALELLPSCDIEKVLLLDERLKAVLNPTGLFLHSLLIPLRSTPETLEIGFAHRTYQEFFLALGIRDEPHAFSDLALPEAVADHLAAVKEEGL